MRKRLTAIAVALGAVIPAAAAASPPSTPLPEGGDPAAEHLRAHELRSSLAARGDVPPAYRASSAGVEQAAEPSAVAPETGGRWGEPFAIPVMGIHAVLLPTGKVMWWSYPQNPDKGYGSPETAKNTATAWLYDLATGTSRKVDPPLARDPVDGQMKPANIWCSGQSLLADGRVLVTGGNLAFKGTDLGDGPIPSYAGLNKVYTFNPFNETWTEQPDMAHGRWYPTQTLLPDGRTVIMSGFDETGGGYSSTNKDVEVFTPSPDMDGEGTITNIGTRGRDAPKTPPDGGLYPHAFAMPSGKLLVAGPDPNDSWSLTPPGDDLSAWGDIPGILGGQRLWGTGVLLPGGPAGSTKVQLLGGTDRTDGKPSDVATPTTETYDEAAPDVGWTQGPAMKIGRSHANTVLLPDGSMATVGGGIGMNDVDGQWATLPDDSQRRIELTDPTTGEWSLGAAQAEDRAYHSTALLLPDATLISAGDDYNGGIDTDTAEIFEPPYLFEAGGVAAARPEMTGAPGSATYGGSFTVGTGGAAIAKAVLVAPGATTHATDMQQRVVELASTPSAGGLTLTAPANAAVAPPGYYMLFLVNAAGVPSKAAWIQLGEAGAIADRAEIEVHNDSAAGAPPSAFRSGFAEFNLAPGASRRVSVPPGHYTVSQAPVAGYELTGIDCAGRAGSVAERRAEVTLAPGNRVACRFTSTKVTAPSAPVVTAPRDRTGPRLAFDSRRGLDARRGIVRGTGSDPSGIARVSVAFGTRGRKCRWWSPARRRLGRASARACRRPAFIRARLARSGTNLRWTVRLRGRVPRGRYIVALRAIDRLGNVTERSGARAPRVAVRR